MGLNVFSVRNRKYLKRAISIYKNFYVNNEEIFGDHDVIKADNIIKDKIFKIKKTNSGIISLCL